MYQLVIEVENTHGARVRCQTIKGETCVTEECVDIILQNVRSRRHVVE